MRVYFVQPPWPGPGYGLRSQNRWPRKRGDKYNRYPILLAYVVTLLKNAGHQVRYLDSGYLELDYEQTLQKIGVYNPDIVYIETATSAFLHDIKFAKLLKQRFPKVILIAAGTHVSYFPEKSLEDAPIDIVIKGEFDLPSLNAVNALQEGGDLSGVLGIAYRDKEGNIKNNPDQPLMKDLDLLPFHIVRAKKAPNGHRAVRIAKPPDLCLNSPLKIVNIEHIVNLLQVVMSTWCLTTKIFAIFSRFFTPQAH